MANHEGERLARGLGLSRLVVMFVVMFGVGQAARAQSLGAEGLEFQVNIYTTNDQGTPSVSLRGVGFVVVWNSSRDGSGRGIFARRFTSTGQGLGGEFQVNAYTVGSQYRPVVAADTLGNFVVAWESNGQDGSEQGIFGRRFDLAGGPIGGEFQVNSFTPGYQGLPRIAVDGDGDFVVVWTSYQQDAFFGGVFGQRFASSGTALAVEFQINSATTTYEYSEAVAFQNDGQFIVSWSNYEGGESSSEVFARRYDSTGSPQAAFQVNVFTTNGQFESDIAVGQDGGFVIVWTSNNQDGSANAIFGRRFASNGSAQGREFQINARTLSSQEEPDIAIGSSDDFVVSWRGYVDEASDVDVFARRIDSAGVPTGGDVQVNSYTSGSQLQPRVAAAGPSGFAVVWRSEQDGSANGVFAQRLGLSTLATLDIDGNGALAPLTDGLLVLRARFGFSGPSLTNGAIGDNCTRCDSTSVLPYINGLGLTLDIDDDDTLQPLTDGLLILRFLFGFGGTTLTGGAVDPDCGRCDAAAIVPYLQTLD
jgi:hypothetical protein